MITLSLPIFTKGGQTTKDLVVQTVLQEKNQTMSEVHHHIKKHYNLSLTYQAVRKSIEKLVEQGVLKKENKTYALHEKWLLQIKSFADQALTKQSRQVTHTFNAEDLHKNFTAYKLQSLFELDNFWGDILVYLAKESKKKYSINIGHYAWWMLINLGRETHVYSTYKELGFDTQFLLLKDNQLNRKAKQVYAELGIHTRVLDEDIIEETTAIDTVGEYVIEVQYPQEIINDIKQYISKHTQGDYDIAEITRIAHKQCEITFNVYHNKEMADAFNKKYQKHL